MRVFLALSIIGCDFRPDLPPLADGPRIVHATITERARVDAVLPTDLDPLPDGGFVVLDGYRGRLLTFSAEGTPGPTIESPALEGAVRITAATEGWWVADPERGEVRRIDAVGTEVASWPVEGATDLALHQGTLWVATRTGPLAAYTPDGQPIRTVAHDVDGEPLASLAALVPGPSGGLLAVDTLGHEVHTIDPEGAATGRWGRFGTWVGTLSKPKAAAVLTAWDAVGVADSSLSAVQLFADNGDSLGVIADAEGPWRVEHPIQLLAREHELLVLDAVSASVFALELAPEAIAHAHDQRTLRHLRTPLIDPAVVGAHAGEARLCRQCHDGFVNDDRYLWDPALAHHPVGNVPDREIPAFFPVDDDGSLRCGTCHTPHGQSGLAEAGSVEEDEGRSTLVRHQASAGDLFTRLSREDAALCVGCHTDAAHDEVLQGAGLEGTSHPTGSALVRALAERTGSGDHDQPAGIEGSCLTCHTPHGALRAPLQREAEAGAVCLGCHEVEVGPSSHPMGRHAPNLRASAELPLDREGIGCVTCHALVNGQGSALIRRAADGGSACNACHDYTGASAHQAEGCATCHAPHDAQGPHLAKTQPTRQDPQGCAACHAEVREHGHPTNLRRGCASCHDTHDPSPPATTCADCHAPHARSASRGPHSEIGCTTCHPAHREGPRVPADQPADGPCLACHGPTAPGDGPRVTAWTHDSPAFGGAGARWEPLRSIVLFRSDGTVAPAHEGGDLACRSCHGVHGPTSGRDDLQLPGWERPCGACHGDETAWRYSLFHHPTKRRSGP